MPSENTSQGFKLQLQNWTQLFLIAKKNLNPIGLFSFVLLFVKKKTLTKLV